MSNDNLDQVYVALMKSITKESAQALVSLMEQEVNKNTRLLIASTSHEEDLLMKGSIRALNKFIKTLLPKINGQT